jgi:hypothetical protein
MRKAITPLAILARVALAGPASASKTVTYSFLIPKYPIGTFAVYSCLGGGTFKATAA